MKDRQLDLIKEEIRELDPELDADEYGFQVAVILMAAAFVTGPNIERLSVFTGYSVSMIVAFPSGCMGLDFGKAAW